MNGGPLGRLRIRRRDLLVGAALGPCTRFPQAARAEPVPAPYIMPADDVIAVMRKVADWQLAHPWQHSSVEWTVGVLAAGMMALGSLLPNADYQQRMLEIGNMNNWELGPRIYFADDHCIGQAYAELYMRYRDARMIEPMLKRFDHILANPAGTSLERVGSFDEVVKRWSWCDALFMGPPTWIRLHAITREPKYLNFLLNEWQAAHEYLYDRREGLYFRDSRYFSRREANGRKVFWARGNGWVMGGLVRVLQFLPPDHAQREGFVTHLRKMAAKVAALQQSDGLWRTSLLDPENHPLKEASGSSLILYALAWGVNQNILDRRLFEPAADRAWAALVDCVTPDGRLTHVQPIGMEPKSFDADHSDVYGIGAFLLAGSEMFRMRSTRAMFQDGDLPRIED
jgi:unsaturated rhamnogalacturonyl hydrolase